LVSDFKSRLELDENQDKLFADLEYGILAELEDFLKELLILLTETYRETFMVKTDNELSTNAQLTKSPKT
jgi:hypothetical protein